MAKLPQPESHDAERELVFYEDLSDIINDVPAGILNSDDAGDEDDDGAGGGSEDEDEDAGAGKTEEHEDDAGDEDEDSDDDEGEDDDEDEDEDDYFTESDDEDEDEEPKKPAAQVPASAPAGIAGDDESKYIIDNLAKIPVNIIVTNDKGEDVMQRVEVYGFGDLPQNFKGYATPLEGEQFRGQVQAQAVKAEKLQDQFRASKQMETVKAQEAEYAKRENRAIAEDLTELRKEGLFPKFKGTPGSKEFNDSDGAKEFDRVIKYMNTKNAEYLEKANSGKAYRHIGFREAYEMLHGPNPKAKEQAEGKTRKAIAGKVRSRGNTKAVVTKAGAARVNNMTDLAEEFNATVGS